MTQTLRNSFCAIFHFLLLSMIVFISHFNSKNSHFPFESFESRLQKWIRVQITDIFTEFALCSFFATENFYDYRFFHTFDDIHDDHHPRIPTKPFNYRQLQFKKFFWINTFVINHVACRSTVCYEVSSHFKVCRESVSGFEWLSLINYFLKWISWPSYSWLRTRVPSLAGFDLL